MEIAVPESIGSMICKSCGIGIGDELSALKKHGSRHNISRERVVQIFESLKSNLGPKDSRALRELYLAKKYGAFPRQLPIIKELPLETLFKCHSCSFCSETLAGIRKHLSRSHLTETAQEFAIKKVKGQAFWAKKDWRVFWLTTEEDDATKAENGFEGLRNILEKLNESEDLEDAIGEDMRDRCAFANIADLDGKLKKMGISWKLAIDLTAGKTNPNDILYSDLKETLGQMVNHFFEVGRSSIENGLYWRSPESIMRAVATPGAQQKNKIFRLLPITSEAAYQNRALRLILFAARVWALQVSEEVCSKKVRVRDEMLNQIHELMSVALKKMETEESKETQSRHSRACAQPNDEMQQAILEPRGCSSEKSKMNAKTNVKTFMKKRDDSDGSYQTPEKTVRKSTNTDLEVSYDPLSDIKLHGKTSSQFKNPNGGQNYCRLAERQKSNETESNNQLSEGLLPQETVSHFDESKTVDAKAVHSLIWMVANEEECFEAELAPTLACTFTACLGVMQFKGSSIQLAMGKHISHVLVAFGYASSISCLLRIFCFPPNRDTAKAIADAEALNSPNGRKGINVFQELLAMTRRTRKVEESHASWQNCSEQGHLHCGYVYGKHVSATDVGAVVMKLQEEVCRNIFGQNGLISQSILTPNFIKEISNIEDDPWNEIVHYSFVKHLKNSRIVSECMEAVKEALRKLFLDKNDSEISCFALEMLRKIEQVAVQTQALLQLSGGMAGRGREVAFQRVKNTEIGGRRSYFLLKQKLVMIPGYSKTTYLNLDANFVCRFPDHVSSFLFKCFVLLVIPMRRSLVGYSSEKKIINSSELNVAHYLISSKKIRLDAASSMAREWQKFGLNLSHHEYRQWNGGYAKVRAETSDVVLAALDSYVPSSFAEFGDPEIGVKSGLQLQSGHSVITGNIHYGRDATGFAANGSLDEQKLRIFEKVSNVWHQDTRLANLNLCQIVSNALGSPNVWDQISRELLPATQMRSDASEKVRLSGGNESLLNENIPSICKQFGNEGKNCLSPGKAGTLKKRRFIKTDRVLSFFKSGGHSEQKNHSGAHHHLDDRMLTDKNMINMFGKNGLTEPQDAQDIIVNSASNSTMAMVSEAPRPSDDLLLFQSSTAKKMHYAELNAMERQNSSEMGTYGQKDLWPAKQLYQDSPAAKRHKIREPDTDSSQNLEGASCSMESKIALEIGTGLKECKFKSITQCISMTAILSLETDLLIVDRTGGGKTALFAGPAGMECGVTVVVVPLKALREDILHRLRKLCIPVELACYWDESKSIPMNGILLAIPEDTSKTEFKHLCGRLFAMKRLKRFVVDEAHETVLAAVYRESMASLRLLRRDTNVPMVLLSATVPAAIEREVIEAHGMTQRKTKVIRGDLSRDNIALEVVHLKNGTREYLFNSIGEELKTVAGHLKVSGGKHIVNCITIDDTQQIFRRMTSLFGAETGVIVRMYHGRLDNFENRKSVEEWNEAYTGIMIATEGFTLGINASNVLGITIAGSSRSIISTWQTIGRCGREGQQCVAKIFFHPNHAYRSGVSGVLSTKLQNDFLDWVQSPMVCMKQKAEHYLASRNSTVPCWKRSLDKGKCPNCRDRQNRSLNKISNHAKTKVVLNSKQGNADFQTKLLFGKSSDGEIFKGQTSFKQESRADTHDGNCERNSVDQSIFASDLREVAQKLNSHCIPCVLKMCKISEKHTRINCDTRKHGSFCYSGMCLLCFQQGHKLQECTAVQTPSIQNGRRGCRWCFLERIEGVEIHAGRGQKCNEYGSKERCPFQQLVSLAIGMWHTEPWKTAILAHKLLGRSEKHICSSRDYFDWLTKDSIRGAAGISMVTRFLAKMLFSMTI